MVGYACFVSTFFAGKWSALLVNFIALVFFWVLLGWQFAERAVGYRTSSSLPQFIVNLHPTMAIAHASELITHSGVGDFQLLSGVRLGFGNIGFDEAHPLAVIMLAMIVGALIFPVLTIYCDMVLPIGPGVKKHPLFIFFPSTYRRPTNVESANQCARPAEANEAFEVTEERNRVL